MKNMTVRGVEPELAARLKQVAGKTGRSVNQTVLDALAAQFGLTKEKRFAAVHHDMDHLFGRWTAAEYTQIQARIDQERRTDDELWR